MKRKSAHQVFTTDLRQKLVSLRHEIHRNPEISFEEHDTAERLERALRDVGLEDIRRVADTGIVARVPGTIPGAPECSNLHGPSGRLIGCASDTGKRPPAQ